MHEDKYWNKEPQFRCREYNFYAYNKLNKGINYLRAKISPEMDDNKDRVQAWCFLS